MKKYFNFKIKLFIILFVLGFSSVSFSQIDVEWENFVKTNFNAGSLLKTAGTNGTGTASSINILYGENKNLKSGKINYNGEFIYTPTNNNENKKIGFSNIDSRALITSEIEYGFSFHNNGKAKAFGFDTLITINYAANKEFKIRREGDLMLYYYDGNEILHLKIDRTENLILRAELTSNNASFYRVKVDFDTKRLIVAPIINNVQNTIKMDIIGGFPPFEFWWEDRKVFQFPSQYNQEVKFNEGIHVVTIIDAQNNKFERTFSVGTDLVWTSFLNTQQQGYTLQKTNSQLWGQALSTVTINKDNRFWFEYLASPQQTSKAFGAVYINTAFSGVSNIETGFLLAKDNQLQIIYKGNAVLTTGYSDKDALLFERNEKGFYWKKNGVEIYFVEDNFTTDLKIGGLLKDYATLSDLHFFNIPNEPILTTWDDASFTGKIDVDISSITGQTGPFHYYISQDPILPLHDFYKLNRDSIFDGVLDSVAFYEGDPVQLNIDFNEGNKTNLVSLYKQHTYEFLENGIYNVAIFDKTGMLVLGQKVELFPALVMIENVGVSQNTNLFRSEQNNASTSLNFYVDESIVKTNLDFKILSPNDKYSMGFSYYDDATKTIQFGFSVENKKVRLIVDGGKQNDKFPVKKDNILAIVKENDKLKFQINGVTLFEKELNTEYLYKTSLLFDQKTTLLEVSKGSGGNGPGGPWQGPWPILYKYEQNVKNAKCDELFGSFMFKTKKTTTQTPSAVNCTLKQGSVVVSTPPSQSTNTYINFPNLEPGIYTLFVTIAPNINYTKTIHIGIEAEFDPIQNYEIGDPNNYSIKKIGSNSQPAHAISVNELKDDENGWILVQPMFSNQHQISYITFSSNNSTGSPSSSDVYMYFYRTSTTSMDVVMHDNNTHFDIPFAIDKTFKMLFTNNQILIRAGIGQDYTGSYYTLDRPAGDIVLRANSYRYGSGFKDILFSFTCKDDLAYIIPSEEFSGGHYIAYKSKIGIYFEEEYGIDVNKTIPIKLYNKSHQFMNSIDLNGVGSLPILPYRENENKHILNLESLTLNDEEYYTLEFTLISGEKRFIKFLNKN